MTIVFSSSSLCLVKRKESGGPEMLSISFASDVPSEALVANWRTVMQSITAVDVPPAGVEVAPSQLTSVFTNKPVKELYSALEAMVSSDFLSVTFNASPAGAAAAVLVPQPSEIATPPSAGDFAATGSSTSSSEFSHNFIVTAQWLNSPFPAVPLDRDETRALKDCVPGHSLLLAGMTKEAIANAPATQLMLFVAPLIGNEEARAATWSGGAPLAPAKKKEGNRTKESNRTNSRAIKPDADNRPTKPNFSNQPSQKAPLEKKLTGWLP